MIYGIDANNNKVRAKKGTNAICACCGSVLVPKCGNLNVWHWAHKSKSNCDSWSSSETEWHIKWKEYFNVKNQEVVMFDELTKEKHIADVRLDNGTVIEFQNSPISLEEMKSREKFYKKMIWVVNASSFVQNISQTSVPYRFRWLYIRKVWKQSKCPVFIHFPTELANNIEAIHLEGIFGKMLWIKEFTRYQQTCNHTYSNHKTFCTACGYMRSNIRAQVVSESDFISKYSKPYNKNI